MMVRCIGEGVRRGFYEEAEEESRRSLVEMADELAAKPGDDLLVGKVRVAEATREEVGRMARAALRRVQVLTGVIAYLNGPAEAPLRLQGESEGDGEEIPEAAWAGAERGGTDGAEVDDAGMDAG